MKRRRQHPFGDPVEGVAHNYSMRLHSRIVDQGTSLRLTGRRGEWRFIRHVIKGDSEWIDVFSPDGQWTSVRTDAVKVVRNKRAVRAR